MRSRKCTRISLLIAVALSGPVTLTHAFEPGHERICTPSADGQTFECRDKVAGEIEKSRTTPIESVATAPDALTAPVATATPAASASTQGPKPTTRKLPNYLMQNSSAVESEGDFESSPAVAGPPTDSEPQASDGQAAIAAPVANASPVEIEAPPSKPVAANQARGVDGLALERAQSSSIEAEPTPPSAAVSSPPVREVPRVMPEAKALAPSPAASHPDSTSLPGASTFLGLPASHYTLVLASVRDASALDHLIKALEAQADQLYLLKLSMPDGDWYSLCWSNFADLDVARAARASLPADAPISSGWPRRIGLLQKEIAR